MCTLINFPAYTLIISLQILSLYQQEQIPLTLHDVNKLKGV